jgi:hypothetical protein
VNLVRRNQIQDLQDHMLSNSYAQPEATVKHTFADGLYAREMTLKANSFVVGALHKTKHLFNISKGSCMVALEDRVEYLEAPYSGVTEIGDKRVITAITDLVWTTYHVTNETDPEKIAELITVKDHRELLE